MKKNSCLPYFLAIIAVLMIACSSEKSSDSQYVPHDFTQITSKQQFKHPGYLRSAAITPDSQYVATGGEEGVVLWDIVTGLEVRRFQSEVQRNNTIWSISFTPDSRIMATGSFDSAILWDVDKGLRIKEFPGSHMHLLYSRDGTRLAMTTGIYTINIFDVMTYKIIQSLDPGGRQNGDNIRTLHFSPDGERLVTGDLAG